MKRYWVLAAIGVASVAQAELDGSQILMEEAARAKEIQRLEYQAEMLKQKAEIARYVEEIQKFGGDVSDLGIQVPRSVAPPSSSGAQTSGGPAVVASQVKTLPTVLHIEHNRAAFDTLEGRVFGKVGQTLPGGYRVIAISMRDGVRLQKGDMRYDIDIAW